MKTKAMCYKLDTFHNRCLRYILNIFWLNTISNTELPQITSNNNSYDLKKKRWRWIRHVRSKEPSNTWKTADRTEKRTVKKVMQANSITWGGGGG